MTGPTAVMFDFDGTLVQTRLASWEVFSKINDEYDLGVAGREEYFGLFRDNIFTAIRARCRDEAHADEVSRAFFDRLAEEYAPPLVPGMVDVVHRLAGRCTLAVVSSNAMRVLRRVLLGHDIAYCFAHVFAGDVAPDKGAAIRQFLADTGSGYGRRCEVHYDEGGAVVRPVASSTFLVTDTAGDVREAVSAGIRVVGVAWGMHEPDELTAAGAEFVAIWPQEIASHILGAAAVEPATGACGGTAAACSCGCSTPDDAAGGAAELARAGAVRRRRRLTTQRPVPAGSTRPSVGVAGPAVAAGLTGAAELAELEAAIRRICPR